MLNGIPLLALPICVYANVPLCPSAAPQGKAPAPVLCSHAKALYNSRSPEYGATYALQPDLLNGNPFWAEADVFALFWVLVMVVVVLVPLGPSYSKGAWKCSSSSCSWSA